MVFACVFVRPVPIMSALDPLAVFPAPIITVLLTVLFITFDNAPHIVLLFPPAVIVVPDSYPTIVLFTPVDVIRLLLPIIVDEK